MVLGTAFCPYPPLYAQDSDSSLDFTIEEPFIPPAVPVHSEQAAPFSGNTPGSFGGMMNNNASSAPTRQNQGSFFSRILGINKLSPKTKQRPVSDKKSVEVVPRETPGSPLPLVRIPMALILETKNDSFSQETRTLPKGFYLVRITEKPQWTVTLIQKDQPVAQFPLRHFHTIQEEANGPVREYKPSPRPKHESSPGHAAASRIAPFTNVRAVPDESGQHLVMQVKQGAQLMETDPIPTQADPRPDVKY